MNAAAPQYGHPATVSGGPHLEALGQSEAFLDFQERLSRAAPVERPVLLIGERGTGKELAAARLHYLSHRWDGPLVSLNCSALSPTLIETELFGHEPGAFTGARQQRQGRFETANGGTLFLDEIGLLPMEVQEKILRAVEYGTFERVGGSRPVEVDVRILAATNADMKTRVSEGRFKQDLLDRLSFEVLRVPPLRERKEDIMLLAHHFARRMAFELGGDRMPEFGETAVRQLLAHHWEGNIRELKNVVERAVYRSDGDLIDTVVLDPFDGPDAGAAPARPAEKGPGPPAADTDYSRLPLKAAVRQMEIDRIRHALQDCRYQQKQAAAQLGLTYDQLRGMIKKYADAL